MLHGGAVLDVDDFKLVNDELGHGVGDLVLTAIAQRLSACVRPSDTVGRFGGDEFVVVCEDLVDDAGALDIAVRVLQALEAPSRRRREIGRFPPASGSPPAMSSIPWSRRPHTGG